MVIHVVADEIVGRTNLLRAPGDIDVASALDGVQSRADEDVPEPRQAGGAGA